MYVNQFNNYLRGENKENKLGCSGSDIHIYIYMYTYTYAYTYTHMHTHTSIDTFNMNMLLWKMILHYIKLTDLLITIILLIVDQYIQGQLVNP